MKVLKKSKVFIVSLLTLSMIMANISAAFADDELEINVENMSEDYGVDEYQEYMPGEIIICMDGNYSVDYLNSLFNNTKAKNADTSSSVVEIKDLTKAHKPDRLRNIGEDESKKKIFLLKLGDEQQDIYNAVEAFEKYPEIEYASPNYVFEMESPVANDYFYEDEEADAVLNMWGLEFVKGPQAWEYCSGSPDVTIGIVDSGVDFNHPDLADNMWINKGEWGENGELSNNGIDDDGNGYVDDYNGWNFYNDTNETYDLYGHGTHVAGTAAASGANNMGVYGVAKDCKVASLKIASNPDSYGYSSYSFAAVIEALDYANAMNIPVTSNSYSQSNNYPPNRDEAFSAIFEAAIDNYNGIFVASSGNDGEGYHANYPAGYDCDNIISVSGSNRLGDPEYDVFNFGADTVDIAAPGVHIWSCENNTNGYVSESGTSMAVPHVTGAVALLKSFKPKMTNAEIKDCILSTVTTTPEYERHPFVAAGGVLNVEAAMAKAEELYPSQIEPADSKIWNFSDDKFAGIGTIKTKTSIDGLTFYPDVKIVDRNETFDDKSFTRYLDMKGKGSDEHREIYFTVTGNTKITVSARTVTEERVLQITDSFGNVVGEMNVNPALNTATFEYNGNPTDIHIRSKKSGIRIYSIETENLN